MQNHLSKPEDLMLQNATLLRTSAPGPPNNSDEHISCIAPATENASLLILFKCPTPAIVFGNATKPSRFARFWQDPQSLAPATRNDIWTSQSGPNPYVFLTLWLRNVLRATTACTFSASQRPKVVRTWCAFNILTSKCASATTACAFSTSTSKSGTFWLRNVLRATTACTCSTSQLPKWSKHGVFCTFWLRNVLRATTACTFSTSQRSKVVRTWCALYILTSKCASRHTGVQLFISHLASWLRTRRFSEPTFRPQIIGKNTVCRDFRTFSRTCIFVLLTLSLLWSSLLLFSSLFFCSTSAFLCPYRRKFDF